MVVWQMPTWVTTLLACVSALLPDLFVHYWASEKFRLWRRRRGAKIRPTAEPHSLRV